MKDLVATLANVREILSSSPDVKHPTGKTGTGRVTLTDQVPHQDPPSNTPFTALRLGIKFEIHTDDGMEMVGEVSKLLRKETDGYCWFVENGASAPGILIQAANIIFAEPRLPPVSERTQAEQSLQEARAVIAEGQG